MRNLDWNIVLTTFFGTLLVYGLIAYMIENDARNMEVLECMNKAIDETGVKPTDPYKGEWLYSYCNNKK